MKLKLIDVETAILSKQVRFDIEDKDNIIKGTLQMYGTQIVPQLEIYNETKWKLYRDYTLAPEQELLAKWLREEHNLQIVIHVHREGWSFNIEQLRKNRQYKFLFSTILDSIVSKKYIETYEEALENGLLKALSLVNKVAE